jgi:hypothetical protein
MARKRTTAPAAARPGAIILQLELHKYAVALWRRDEDGEPVYEIVHENIREVSIAVMLARKAAKAKDQ